MKKVVILMSMLFSYQAICSPIHIDDGVYYAQWINEGGNKDSSILPSKPLQTGGRYYMKVSINDDPNDEVYMKVSNESVVFFYKHDEIEGGPLIGWRNAVKVDNGLITTNGQTKNIYSVTGGKTDKKYYVGDKFEDGSISPNQNEFVPLTKINESNFKLDCSVYLKENAIKNNELYSVRDYSQNYDNIIFMSDSGICGSLLDKSSAKEVKNGWIVFKKIE